MSKRKLDKEIDLSLANEIIKWRDKSLSRIHSEIESHFLSKSPKDFTLQEKGFEQGLVTALNIIEYFMNDKSNYKPKNKNTYPYPYPYQEELTIPPIEDNHDQTR